MVISVKTSSRGPLGEVHLVLHLVAHLVIHLVAHLVVHLVIHLVAHLVIHLVAVIQLRDILTRMVCVSVCLDIWVLGALT
jgi:hypothetical protein